MLAFGCESVCNVYYFVEHHRPLRLAEGSREERIYLIDLSAVHLIGDLEEPLID